MKQEHQIPNKGFIIISAQESLQFSAAVLNLLVSRGFHVRSLQEALSCLDSVVEFETTVSMHTAMSEKTLYKGN